VGIHCVIVFVLYVVAEAGSAFAIRSAFILKRILLKTLYLITISVRLACIMDPTELILYCYLNLVVHSDVASETMYIFWYISDGEQFQTWYSYNKSAIIKNL
jgi:hypothetical protein